MNLKRIFGALLTVLGIGLMIYSAMVFTNIHGTNREIRSLIVFGVLGVIFFGSGISLVKTTKDL